MLILLTSPFDKTDSSVLQNKQQLVVHTIFKVFILLPFLETISDSCPRCNIFKIHGLFYTKTQQRPSD